MYPYHDPEEDLENDKYDESCIAYCMLRDTALIMMWREVTPAKLQAISLVTAGL
jgi:hypothetical protein